MPICVLQGYRHFDFVPLTFIMPSEFQDFCSKLSDESFSLMVPD